MKKIDPDENRVSSTSYKQYQNKLNTNEMIFIDDENYNESYYSEKTSNQSFGICKKTQSDQISKNSGFFDDSDAIKYNEPNQSVDIFTNRLYFNDDQQLKEIIFNQQNENQDNTQKVELIQENIEKIEIPIIQPKKIKINSKIRKVRKKKLNFIKKSQTKIKIKNISKFNFESLALRNIKTNFASGLIQFIQFRQDILNDEKSIKAEQLKNIIKFLYLKLPALRSFSGWREIWKDLQFGLMIRKLSLLFFQNMYIYDYVNGSRVKQDYKKEYLKKIPKFIQGTKNYHLFNSYNFNL